MGVSLWGMSLYIEGNTGGGNPMLKRMLLECETVDAMRELAASIGEGNVGAYAVSDAGGNVGVAEAVRDTGYKNQIIFIGHELNKNSKQLLDTEEMSYVIGHDINLEVEKSFSIIEDFYNEAPINNFRTNTFIYTKYNSTNYKTIF